MTSFLVRLFVKDSQNTGDAKVRSSYGNLASFVGIFCNLLLFSGKLLAGLLSGSIAIVADAVNNLSDASSSIITLIGFRLSAKPADDEHPFGHARFEYIAGLAVAVMVIVIGIELAKTSVTRIFQPEPVNYTIISYIVMVASILLKSWMALFNRTIGKKIGSTALEATSADSRNDVITTSAVLVTAIIANFTGLHLDSWVGLAVAAFILYSGAGLVKATLDPLLGEAPTPEYVKYISDKITSYDGVLGTHDLIVHDYGPGRKFASAHVEMSSDANVLDSHDIIDNIERDFLEQDNLHLIIHFDPIATGDDRISSTRNKVVAAVKKIDDRLTIHDFRMVVGASHKNYIFDVVVPPEYPLTDTELIEKISEAVQEGPVPIHVKITIDVAYTAIPH